MSDVRLRMDQLAAREAAQSVDDGAGSGTMPVTTAQIGERLCAFHADVVVLRTELKAMAKAQGQMVDLLREIRDQLERNGERMDASGRILYELTARTATLHEQGARIETAVSQRIEQVAQLAGGDDGL